MSKLSRGALGITLAALLAACSQPTTGPPPATDRCGEVEFPPVQFGSHLLGDTQPPIPYSSTPPTSGWHSSGSVPEGVPTQPLSEPAQVSVLEAGGVVVTHNGLSDAELERLTATVAERFDDRVVLTPYGEIPAGSTAFTSWGALQICEGVDLEALTAYTAAYASPISPHDT
ncbi:MAG TPA: DUF3105 domain-containing protein [Euzebya sp.]|nr:DUF3105 domain-containing protein [Euzebya sp.]